MSKNFDLQGPSAGFFNQAHHFTIQSAKMIDSMKHENYLMESLAKHTMVGAEFDSSARDPPPNCHPGTRLDISGKLQSWMRDPARKKNLMWVHGPAGVGKSAIMQTLAESEHDSDNSILGATLFFSRSNQRHDSKLVFLTIAYQLAVKYQPYRSHVLDLLVRDPKMVEKSLSEQFKRFIVKPFTEKNFLEGLPETTLIILDGLDECMGERSQREIILLIGSFALEHPDVPLIWIVTSRPEPHIQAAFASRSLQSSHSQLEVPIDSTQACLDVEKYLRFEFDEIREKYPTSFSPTTQQWPSETQFTKIVHRSSGLFAFATAVVRFIDDLNYANPVYKLQRVLNVIDSVKTEGQDNPFATLDALYMEIMSSVPLDLLPTVMTLLDHILTPEMPFYSFKLTCNWLGIGQADAYSALQKLHAVLNIPLPQEASEKQLCTLHKSFADFLLDPFRSGSFLVRLSGEQEKTFWRCSQILKDAHNIEEKTIQISRINLSWGSPGSGEEVGHRREIFLGALVLLLKSPERPSAIINMLTLLLEDLDLEELLSFFFTEKWHGDYVLWIILNHIYDCFVLQDLEEHNVVRTVSISTLNLEHIRVIIAARIDRPRTLEVDNEYFEEDSFGGLVDREHPEAAIVLNELVNGDVGAAFGRRSDLGPEFEESLTEYISTILEKTPSLQIVFYGGDRNGSILLSLDFKDDEWLVLASCKPL